MKTTVALVLGALACGCAETPRKDPVSALRSHPYQPLLPAGVTMQVSEITPATLHRHRALVLPISSPLKPLLRRKVNPVTAVPLPTFEVTLVNRSPVALDFADARISLVDSKGRQFDAILDVAAVQGRVERWLIEQYPDLSGQDLVLSWLRRTVGDLPLLTPSLIIPAGGTWKGLVPVRMDMHDAEELETFLRDIGWVALRMDCVHAGEAPVPLVYLFERVPGWYTARHEQKPGGGDTRNAGGMR
jgi:hypothetical protein